MITAMGGRFIVNEQAATVTDEQLGLVWKRYQEGGETCLQTIYKYDWKQALALANGEWRLPTIDELMTLITVMGEHNKRIFPLISPSQIWSSTAESDTTAWAYSAYFYGKFTNLKSYRLPVLMIRT